MGSLRKGHQVEGEMAGTSEQGKATSWNSQQKFHGFGGDGRFLGMWGPAQEEQPGQGREAGKRQRCRVGLKCRELERTLKEDRNKWETILLPNEKAELCRVISVPQN